MRYQKTAGGRHNGRYAVPEVSDRFRYGATTTYTPEKLKAIFDAANSGDIEAMTLCGREILERNWDIIGAMEQRATAIQGVPYDVQPGGDQEADAAAAKAFDQELRDCGSLKELDTFYDFIGHCTSAVIQPFAASEIVWGDGGKLEGFAAIEPHHFTLRDGFVPRLVCREWPSGMPENEAKNRFVFHQFRKKADPARAGLIRVLAWLHCFQNWPLKDLFSFIERFGMPFVVAKVDKRTWDDERAVLHALIRNFGPSGGGVFTQSTDVQLLNAANTGGDNVYFKALEFTHDAIYTLLVGQLASSGDSSGMSNGTTQDGVRQDILAADARSIESTVRARIAAPWTLFNYGPGVAVPRLHFQVEPPEDLAALATTVATLYNGGLEADPAEMSDKFKIKLTRRVMPDSTGMGAGQGGLYGQMGQIAPAVPESSAEMAPDKEAVMYGALIRAGLLTPTRDLEESIRAKLNLAPLPAEAEKLWDASGGVRKPLTIKDTTDIAADTAAMSAEDKRKDDLADALTQWLGPVADKAAEIADLSDDEFDAALKRGIIPETGSSEMMERMDAANMQKERTRGNQNQG